MQTRFKSPTVLYWCKRFVLFMPVRRHWNLLLQAEVELEPHEFHQVRRYAKTIRANTRESDPTWGC